MERKSGFERNPLRVSSSIYPFSSTFFFSTLLVGLLVLSESSHPAVGSWRTSAVSKLMELEETLLKKETSLLEMKEGVQELRDAEERGGRRYIRRAAFDVGSGATKILVADVDMHAGPLPAISKVVFQKKVSILMSEDLQKSGQASFSSGILHELMETLKEFKREADEAGAEQFAGAATAAFRKAKNGPDFLEQVRGEGIELRIIPQEEEGSIGFLTGSQACPHILGSDLVVWDSGGGSFQISSMEQGMVCSWMRSLGSGIATGVLVEVVQGKDFKTTPSPNPVTIGEAQELGFYP